MKLLRKILIRSGIWGLLYPPFNLINIKIHRDWPWKEKKRLSVNEIVSIQPMTTNNSLFFEYSHPEYYEE